MRIFDLSHFWNWPNAAICARLLFITISLTTTQTMTQIKSGMFGFLTFCNRTITPKIRLFSAICGKNRVYVISLVFVKKVLTKRDSVCYNNQAVSETGDKNPGNGQRANLENDTEETSTRSCGLARRAERQERGSEIKQSEFYE